MPRLPKGQAPDFYLATNSDVFGWGGGVSLTSGLAAGLETFGYRCVILGIDEGAGPAATPRLSAGRLNLRSGFPRRLWRVRSWCLGRALAGTLGELPAPQVAFVGVHPYWVLAARRAWPEVPLVFCFACLLTNCLPFTWPRRRPPGFWGWVDYAGIRRSERLALRQADLIVAPTNQSVEEIAAFEPACRPRLRQCYYGVHAPAVSDAAREQQRAELGLSADRFVLAVIGRCDRNKAFDWAVRVLPRVDPRVHLLVVGGGPEDGAMRCMASTLGVSDRVTFAGAQAEMSAWYAAADCVLSTSHYDTFPNVLLEALSAGKPVVVPRHDPPRTYSGVAELVERFGCGRLYWRHDLASLARCLDELSRDRAAAARMGQAGRRLAEQHFSWRMLAVRVLELLGREVPQPESVGPTACCATTSAL